MLVCRFCRKIIAWNDDLAIYTLCEDCEKIEAEAIRKKRALMKEKNLKTSELTVPK